MQVNHNQSLEFPFPTEATTVSTSSTGSPSMQTTSGRRLAAASTQASHTSGMTIDRASAHDRPLNEHAIMSELMMDSKDGLRKLGPARGLLSAEAETPTPAPPAPPIDLWFGYDVHYHSRPVQRDNGSFAPRYVGSRNQVLGGLYFQQVSAQYILSAAFCNVQLVWPVWPVGESCLAPLSLRPNAVPLTTVLYCCF